MIDFALNRFLGFIEPPHQASIEFTKLPTPHPQGGIDRTGSKTKFFISFYKECLGVIFEDENTTEGINQALHQFHSYVPRHSSQGETVFNRVGVVGDQLSVERAVNCILSLAN